MSNEIDTGFFEPFRGNIIEIKDGFFTIKIINPIAFDRNIVMKYFDEAVVEYNRINDYDRFAPVECTVTVKPKTPEIEQILLNMFYNPVITIPNGFSDLFKSPATD